VVHFSFTFDDWRELPKADAWIVSLLTNPEVLAVDQHSSESHPVIATGTAVVWLAEFPRMTATTSPHSTAGSPP